VTSAPVRSRPHWAGERAVRGRRECFSVNRKGDRGNAHSVLSATRRGALGSIHRRTPLWEAATGHARSLRPESQDWHFTEEDAFDWADPPPFTPAGDQALDLSAGQAARAAVAAKLVPGWDIDLHGLTAADFLRAPEVAAHG
jgi:hypothetical protein